MRSEIPARRERLCFAWLAKMYRNSLRWTRTSASIFSVGSHSLTVVSVDSHCFKEDVARSRPRTAAPSENDLVSHADANTSRHDPDTPVRLLLPPLFGEVEQPDKK